MSFSIISSHLLFIPFYSVLFMSYLFSFTPLFSKLFSSHLFTFLLLISFLFSWFLFSSPLFSNWLTWCVSLLFSVKPHFPEQFESHPHVQHQISFALISSLRLARHLSHSYLLMSAAASAQSVIYCLPFLISCPVETITQDSKTGTNEQGFWSVYTQN